MTVAQRHFDDFIAGSTVAAPTSPRPAKPPTPPATRPSSGLSQPTYATVANKAMAMPTPLAKAAPKKAPLKEPIPDNRLFVRLPEGHNARGMPGYAVLDSLRAQLGSDSPLLREVQATKTGFALCPSSPMPLGPLRLKGKRSLTSLAVPG
jgi:hypothetical protein